jgi:hypothetical protein
MTTIKLKNGSGAPDAADLVQGEVALDLTNKRIYSENASGTVIEMGTSPSTIDINAGTIDGVTIGGASAGAITGTTITGTSFVSSGDMTFGDDDKAIFGAGSDLQIYHNGSNSYIKDAGTGTLNLQSSDTIRLQTSDGAGGFQNVFAGVDEGAAFLYYDGADKLATTSTGIDVTGTVTADGLVVNTFFASDVSPASSITSTGNQLMLQGATNGVGQSVDLIFQQKLTNSNSRAGGKISSIAVNSYTAGSGTTNDSALVFYAAQDGVDIERLRILSNGDFQLYEDTGTTAKLFWDASAESLGIGTATPGTVIDARQTSTGGTTQIRLYNTDNSNTTTQTAALFLSPDSRASGALISGVKENADFSTTTARDVALVFSPLVNNVATERLRIDSSGNVGIGTTSPDRTLQIGDGGTAASNVHTLMRIEGAVRGGSLNGATLEFVHVTNAPSTLVSSIGTITEGGRSDTAMQFKLNNTERARIDSSGNLLVGKTAASFTVAGHEIKPGGFAGFTRDGASPIVANRLTSDGDIIEFYKGASAVGSIGTAGGTLQFKSGNSGIIANSGLAAVYPLTPSSTDLGYSTVKWRDLYLSGSVYLGGTTSANALDDYEEGTWTPTISQIGGTNPTITYSVQVGTYVKIGRLVIASCRVNFSAFSGGSGSAVLESLPFTTLSTANSHNVGSASCSSFTANAPTATIAIPNTTRAELTYGGGTTSYVNTAIGNFQSTSNLFLTVIYQTA